MNYEEILRRKIEYYGDTEAAREFAAEEYAARSRIEELDSVLNTLRFGAFQAARIKIRKLELTRMLTPAPDKP